MLLDSVSFGHIFLKKVEGFKSKNERLVLSAPEKSENALEEEQIGEGTTSSSLEAEKSRFWRRSANLCLNLNSII